MTPWDDALAVAAKCLTLVNADHREDLRLEFAYLIHAAIIRGSNAELERKRNAERERDEAEAELSARVRGLWIEPAKRIEPAPKHNDPPLGRANLDVAVELHKARTKHAQMHSAHEGYAAISEELDELWEEIKKRKPDPVRLRAEAVQVAAMAMRFLVDVCQPPDTPVEHVAEEVREEL